MALIHLKHDIHGEKIATLELEAEYDEKHGWVRYTPGEDAPVEQLVNELRPRRRKEPLHVDNSR
jgi:hypothetical protein